MDKKYMVFYGNKITESGKYIISNDELFESNRIAEGAFPEKLKLEGVKKSKIEKINKKCFVLSGYESGKKVKGQPKSFLFYKKID